MKRVVTVLLVTGMLVGALASSASAVISYGTRNIKISHVHSGICDNTLVDALDDVGMCDVSVWGKITVRNSGTKELVVSCPVNVWKLGVEGIVASTVVSLRIKAGRARTIVWKALGSNTIPVGLQSNSKWEYTALRRSELRVADPVQEVFCI